VERSKPLAGSWEEVGRLSLSEKVNKAIDRIKTGEEMRAHLYPDALFYLAYSAGKDSDTVRILFQLADVPFDLWHNHTTVEAPETVHYLRSIPGINISYPEKSMWQLIVHKGMPPTRLMHYCCTLLKERGGKGRFVATGVRWAESPRRKAKRNSLEILPSNLKNVLVLNADNTEDRRLFEGCQTKGKRILNPIIDWSDDEVWQFLNHYGCESNPLYKCGFKRVGCIGCPMAGKQARIKEFERYPKYYDAYLRAFGRMLDERIARGKPTEWKTADEVMHWWLYSQK
jgi:phosphoadenosine phosphosulfate reductase